ncbi:complement C1r subcomponent [Trichosurus vulpecula]|uniref:complement C1r subcomponent n=1 Tax=Trichosurus vulpecula TaxID=9337 RepID=UPI00186B4E10|nr:complement C1r subcomponent [Trichosurus vulpecula]
MSLWHLLGFLLLCKLGGSVPITHDLYGEVTSPMYPKPYPNNYDDTREIVVPKGYSVKLVFWQFDLEPSEGCFYDYVKISTDKKDLGRFCGQLGLTAGNPPVQKEFVSQGNQMWLKFHTDFSNEENGTTIFYKGFLAYYQAVDMNECTAQDNTIEENSKMGLQCEHFCHNSIGSYFCSCRAGYELQADGHSCRAECSSELFTEASGYISSLEYPKPYPPDMRCNYSIRVDRGLSINLEFLEPFEIDDHEQVHCPYDQLQVYASGNPVGEYCGMWSPGVINTSSNAVDVLFFTDESGDSRGWKIRYTTEVIKCPQPKALDEFTVINNLQQQYQFRDYLIVTCKAGYQLTEGNQKLKSFTSVCQDDGTWHRAMPHCKIMNCGAPQHLPKGSFTYLTKKGRNTYKAEILYTCQEPFYQMANMEKNVTYTCSDQGIWKEKHGNRKIPLCLPVCGKPINPVVENQRIIAGKSALPGNFPWQAFTNIHGRGGGALLGDKWILTAAHTIYPKGKNVSNDPFIGVFLGHTNLDEIMKMGIHPVRRFFVHPGYNQNDLNSFDNDIALLELENSVPLNPNLLPICLPDRETFYEKGYVGYVSGFGKEEQRLHDDLKFVSLPMVSRKNCQEWLNSKKSNLVFSDNMFCAGDKTSKQDACQGDSGGVFAVKDETRDRWLATGIVSWGIDCGYGHGFYTKVLQYVDWIKGIIESES